MTSLTQPVLTKQQLLTDLLKRVSRSFYLTLRMLPGSLRDQIGLSYLFARTADTIADTSVLEPARRLRVLRQFKLQFEQGTVDWGDLKEIREAVLQHQTDSAERQLVERVEDVFRVFLEFSPEDQRRICVLMQSLTPGMEMDLTAFPGETVYNLKALRTMGDLDRYIYHVAGCVGEFWTHMCCAHLPALATWDVAKMSEVGVRYGKGLQLTNVLKDIARDLQCGRCYIPEELLKRAGLRVKDLRSQESLPRLRPVLKQLIGIAAEHLDQGWLYTLAIPPQEVRLRLACMWPILFAGETLRQVASSPTLLDPAVNVKMTRGQVYGLMVSTALTRASSSLWTAYWGRLRKQIA